MFITTIMEALLKVLFHFCFFSLLVNSVVTQSDSVPLSSRVERVALLNLRASLGIRAIYWPRKADPCANWTGVNCFNGRVTGINLSGLKRTRFGKLNPSFAIDSLVNCTRLVSFNSSGFDLPGSIPDWLGQNLSALQVLDLRSSSVFGPIPQSIGSLNQLNVLLDNSLTGIIPDSLSQLSSLSNLNLSVNMLTGSIPSTVSSLRSLEVLDLSSNFLSGPIPSEVGLLSGLEILKLSNNSLTDSVPVEIGNLSKLVELDLSSNDLGGDLFGNVTINMPDIVFLDVSSNNLTSELPDFIAFPNASRVSLNFSNNQFYGNVSSSLRNVGFFDLSNNYLQGLEVRTGNGTSLPTNCFRGHPDQRGLNDCETFNVRVGLPFDRDSIAPVPPPMPKKSSKRLKYVLAGVFGGLGVIAIIAIILVIMFKTCNKRS